MPKADTRELNQDVVDLINDQIVLEIYSAHLYLSMSAWFSEHGLDGYAHWYYIQHLEELDHAKIFYLDLIELGAEPVIGAIDAPDSDFKDVEDILVKTYEHELYITASIHKIYDEAIKKGEYRVNDTLEWFVAEQVEEESNTSTNLDRFRLFAKESPSGLKDLDDELAQRVLAKGTRISTLEAEI
ncbi:MAG: ferritin [Coriobacteriia bacterium]|nr:ferritin [Coriobacteriia bacterium]